MKITKKILYIVGIIFSLLLIGLGIFISINKNEKIFVDIYTSLIHVYRVDNNINFGVHMDWKNIKTYKYSINHVYSRERILHRPWVQRTHQHPGQHGQQARLDCRRDGNR